MCTVGNEGKEDNEVENTKKGNFYNKLDKCLENYQKIERKMSQTQEIPNKESGQKIQEKITEK